MNTMVIAQNAPAAVGPYSHAVVAGNMMFTSGQLGLVPQSGELCEGVEKQARQALNNLITVLEEKGFTLNDVVKTTVFLKNMSDFGNINAIYAEYFTQMLPARSCVEVAALPKGALFEIEAVAVK